ncbi:hypothetical protein DNTS_035131, partial [Danionella cerebrum]
VSWIYLVIVVLQVISRRVCFWRGEDLKPEQKHANGPNDLVLGFIEKGRKSDDISNSLQRISTPGNADIG